jgi:hypothetical protein
MEKEFRKIISKWTFVWVWWVWVDPGWYFLRMNILQQGLVAVLTPSTFLYNLLPLSGLGLHCVEELSLHLRFPSDPMLVMLWLDAHFLHDVPLQPCSLFWLRKALAPEKEQQSSHPFISLHVELVLSTRFPASIRTKERSNTKIFSTHKCRLSQSASLLFSDTGGPWERGRQEFWRGMQLSRGPLNIGFRTKCKVLVWPFLRILVLNRFTCNS